MCASMLFDYVMTNLSGKIPKNIFNQVIILSAPADAVNLCHICYCVIMDQGHLVCTSHNFCFWHVSLGKRFRLSLHLKRKPVDSGNRMKCCYYPYAQVNYMHSTSSLSPVNIESFVQIHKILSII